MQTHCRPSADTLQTKCRHNADTVQTHCSHNADTLPLLVTNRSSCPALPSDSQTFSHKDVRSTLSFLIKNHFRRWIASRYSDWPYKLPDSSAKYRLSYSLADSSAIYRLSYNQPDSSAIYRLSYSQPDSSAIYRLSYSLADSSAIYRLSYTLPDNSAIYRLSNQLRPEYWTSVRGRGKRTLSLDQRPYLRVPGALSRRHRDRSVRLTIHPRLVLWWGIGAAARGRTEWRHCQHCHCNKRHTVTEWRHCQHCR